jgi:hypothetical protein
MYLCFELDFFKDHLYSKFYPKLMYNPNILDFYWNLLNLLLISDASFCEGKKEK